MGAGRITLSLNEGDFHFFNDENFENMFTLAAKRKNVKIILEVMKGLS